VRLTYLDRVRLERAGVRPPTTVAEFKAAAERLKAAAARPAVTLSLAAVYKTTDGGKTWVSRWRRRRRCGVGGSR